MRMYLRRQETDKLFYSGNNGVPAWTENIQSGAKFFMSFNERGCPLRRTYPQRHGDCGE